jgi:hypothetical protein
VIASLNPARLRREEEGASDMWPPPVSDQGERETLLLRYWAGPSGGSRGKAGHRPKGEGEKAGRPGSTGSDFIFFFLSFFHLYIYFPKPNQLK